MGEPFRYWVFISYSRRDAAVGRWPKAALAKRRVGSKDRVKVRSFALSATANRSDTGLRVVRELRVDEVTP